MNDKVVSVVRLAAGSSRRLSLASSLLVGVIGGVALVSCGGSGGEREPRSGQASTNDAVRIELTHFDEPVGAASLEPIDSDHTRVVVRLRKPTAWGRADIHARSCLEHDPSVIVDLGTVYPGESLEASADVSLETLTLRPSSLLIHTTLNEQHWDACADIRSSSPAAPLTLPRRAAQLAACYEPVDGWGLVEGACSRIETIERVRDGVWRLQLRHPPVYCVEVHLNDYLDDGSAIIEGVGRLTEEPCPASAYPAEPEPDVQATLRSTNPGSRTSYGSVSLTAVSKGQTRVVVEADMDVAEIVSGKCGSQTTGQRFALNDFYSFRSVTELDVPLRTLTATPHALFVDSGGAHGGEFLACAELHD